MMIEILVYIGLSLFAVTVIFWTIYLLCWIVRCRRQRQVADAGNISDPISSTSKMDPANMIEASGVYAELDGSIDSHKYVVLNNEHFANMKLDAAHETFDGSRAPKYPAPPPPHSVPPPRGNASSWQFGKLGNRFVNSLKRGFMNSSHNTDETDEGKHVYINVNDHPKGADIFRQAQNNRPGSKDVLKPHQHNLKDIGHSVVTEAKTLPFVREVPPQRARRDNEGNQTNRPDDDEHALDNDFEDESGGQRRVTSNLRASGGFEPTVVLEVSRATEEEARGFFGRGHSAVNNDSDTSGDEDISPPVVPVRLPRRK